MKHTRHFGIELELSRRLTRINNANRANSYWWRRLSDELMELRREGLLGHGWKLKTDLSCGGEIVSPVLTYPKGITEIAIVCDMVKKIEKEAKIPVTDGECGLHFHFDVTDFAENPRKFSNLFILIKLSELIFYQMYPNRRMDFAGPLEINMRQACRIRDLNDLKDVWYRGSNNVKDRGAIYENSFLQNHIPGERYDGTRYHGFNIHCFYQQGTVEFRYCEATFDPLHIVAWYEMCLAIVETAANVNVVDKKWTKSLYNYEYANLKSFLVKPTKFRKLIIDLMKLCNFSRSTKRLIIEKVKENNPNLLEKPTPPNVINNTNVKKYAFKDMTDGSIYDHQGNKIQKIGRRRIVSCERLEMGDLNMGGKNAGVFRLIPIKKSRMILNYPVVITPPVFQPVAKPNWYSSGIITSSTTTTF